MSKPTPPPPKAPVSPPQGAGQPPLFGPGHKVSFLQGRMRGIFGKRTKPVKTQHLNAAASTPGSKKSPLINWMRTGLQGLLLGAVFTSALFCGNHLSLEMDRAGIEARPYDGWSQSVYSQELRAWQNDNIRTSERYNLAIIDIDQFLDPDMTKAQKQDEFRRQVSAMLPPRAVQNMQNNGTLDKAFVSLVNDRGTAHSIREPAISFGPAHHSTGHFDLTDPNDWKASINIYMTDSFVIIISSDGLKTPDQRLRGFAALNDVGYGFQTNATAEMERQWIVAHEVGHGHDGNTGSTVPHEDTAGESMADAFAAIDHIARFGPRSNFPEVVADARALGAIRGSVDHYTSPAVYEAAATARDLFLLGQLATMTHAEKLELAGTIAQKHEMTTASHQKMVELSRVLRGYDSDDTKHDGFYNLYKLDPAALQADLDEWASHPFFSTTPEVQNIADYMRAAFAERLLPSNELTENARPEAQLRALLEERGTSPDLRERIFKHAHQELNDMRPSSNRSNINRQAFSERQRAIQILEREFPIRDDAPKGPNI